MMKTSYDTPVQLLWYDEENKVWQAGIGFGDKIICAECGGVIEVDDLVALAAELGDDTIVEYSEWVDFTEEIAGGPADIKYHLEGNTFLEMYETLRAELE